MIYMIAVKMLYLVSITKNEGIKGERNLMKVFVQP